MVAAIPSSVRADASAQTCGHLERQAADLEATAHPALDALTRVVTTATLERVRTCVPGV